MATLSIQSIGLAGAVPTYATAANNGAEATPTYMDKFRAGAHTYLHVKNGSGDPTTVTVNDPNSDSPTAAFVFDPDIAVTIAGGAEKVLGPFPAARFRDPSDGLVHVTYSAVTSITVGVFSV